MAAHKNIPLREAFSLVEKNPTGSSFPSVGSYNDFPSMTAPTTTLSNGPFSSTISANAALGSTGGVVGDFSSRSSAFLPRSYAQALRRPDIAQSSMERSYAPISGAGMPVTSGSPSSSRRRGDEGLLLAPNGLLPSSSGNGVTWGGDAASEESGGGGVGGSREASSSSFCSPLALSHQGGDLLYS